VLSVTIRLVLLGFAVGEGLANARVLDGSSRMESIGDISHVTVQSCVVADSKDLAGSRSRRERRHDATTDPQ
jgi:hypothetical protein